jgi:hypothetical protein
VNPHPGAQAAGSRPSLSPSLSLSASNDICFDGRSMSLARAVPGQSSVGSMGYIQTKLPENRGIFGRGEAKTCRNEVEMPF